MKVVVVGAGAMGTIYAAMFRDAGHDVWFVEASQAIAEAVNQAGAIVTGPDGRDRTYAIPATTAPDKLDIKANAALFQVKGFATAAAAELARPVISKDTIILTLQNGLGNEDVLRRAYPDNPVVIGTSLHSAAMIGPGRVHHTGVRVTSIGPARPEWSGSAETIRAALAQSAYAIDLYSEQEVRREIFAKWVLNCGSLATAALTGLATPRLRPTRRSWD